VSGAVLDLRADSGEDVVAICSAFLTRGAHVLHGSHGPGPLERIEPRQANDAAKASGNHMAVYASVDVQVALMHAVLDRTYLLTHLDSYRAGYRRIAGRLVFRVTDNLYRLIEERVPEVFSEGYVYVLDRKHFVGAPESSTEFYSFDPVAPFRSLRVSASLGLFLFRVGVGEGTDTVLRYTM